MALWVLIFTTTWHGGIYEHRYYGEGMPYSKLEDCITDMRHFETWLEPKPDVEYTIRCESSHVKPLIRGQDPEVCSPISC